MDKNENAEERVTDGDSVRKDVTNLTQGEGRLHSSILVRDYETLIEAIERLDCHFGVLSNTVAHDGEYLKPRENNHDLMRARDLLIGLRRTLQEREQDAHARSKEGRIDLTQFEGLPDAPWGYGYWEYENTRLYEGKWDNEKIPDLIQCQRWWIVCPTDGQGHLRSSTDGTGFVNPDMVMIPCDEPTFSEGIDRRPAIVDAVNALPEILAEVKKHYKREDELLEALRIIRDDLDDALKVYPILNKEDVEKVRNFANDASQ